MKGRQAQREVDAPRRVLLLARQFLPYHPSLGGVIRVLKMAEFLRERGAEVFVVAAGGERIDDFGYGPLLKELNVTYVSDPLHLTYTRKINRYSYDGDERARRPAGLKGRLLEGLKRLANDVSVPDKDVYFVNRYVKQAAELIRRHKVRNLIVSSPPHSMQLAGLALKRRFAENINFIVDYRDSWNTTRIFEKRNPISKFLSLRLEKMVLDSCDHFTFVSQPMLAKINKTFFASKASGICGKSRLVMNGYDMSLDATSFSGAPKRREGALTIGYFGELTDGSGSPRNPTPLLEALMRCQKNVRLVLCGHIDIDREWCERLSDKLEVRPRLSHQDALRAMAQMDALLLLHSEEVGADEVITGKFFEYVRSRRPILLVGPATMEAVRLVHEHRLGYTCCIDSPNNIIRTLDRLYEDWSNGQLASYEGDDLVKFSRVHQFSKLLDLLV